MLFSLTYTGENPTSIGYLLGKHPERVNVFPQSFGTATVFYPEITETSCTIALILEIDTIGLIRGRNRVQLAQYVNDRPYVASSFMSVALKSVFRSAMIGRHEEFQDLADADLELSARFSCVPCRGGEAFLRELFEPLGYAIDAKSIPLDESFPAWGDSDYFELNLMTKKRLSDVLNHLYVLLPVLDNDKHYWIDQAEIEKLLAAGEGWLADHPLKEAITRRYLRHKWSFARVALEQLADVAEKSESPEESDAREEKLEQPLSLHEQRHALVVQKLLEHEVTSVVDVGCASGKLLQRLTKEPSFVRIGGMDVSSRSLVMAKQRLHWDTAPERLRQRVSVFQGSLVYQDKRLKSYDAVVCIEVIEHLDPFRLQALEHSLFAFTRPRVVIVTTPNMTFNQSFEGFTPGKLRHADHRFEWTQDEFQTWAGQVATAHGYRVEFLPVGESHPEFGPPTQMGVFVTCT